MFMPLQGITPGNSWLGGISLKVKMENRNKGNENKIILGDFNCSMDKMDRDGENKTQRLYWFCSNYALSKFIVNHGLEDLWRRGNPDFFEFTATIGPLAKIQDRQGLY